MQLSKQPWFAPGDVDGFFGLAVDNLIQFLLILSLCGGVLGFPHDLLLGAVMPGAALSILVGNLWYAHMARRLAAQTGRTDVTALPYGINTVSLFAYVFLVMLPVKSALLGQGIAPKQATHTAYQIGLAACLLSALLETAGAPVANWIRRMTPRAALLSSLSGIAMGFISMDFAAQTFESPVIALLPLTILLANYFGRARLPFGLPGGLWAVLCGTALAWACTLVPNFHTPIDPAQIAPAAESLGLYLPVPMLNDLWAGLTHPLLHRFLVPVILPMGLFNVLGSLQNLESAEAAGDTYPTAPSLLVNGLGSTVAAVFGSCFPTTIYIGHPGWKALGARSGYSILSGLFFVTVALCGASDLLNTVVPLEAGMGIVLWIGIIITAQAFQATPRNHAPAVALGLFPAIAAWGVLLISQTLNAANIATGASDTAARTLGSDGPFALAGLHLDGLFALSQGFMLICLVWAACAALLIDGHFKTAALWLLLGAALSFFGFMHAGQLTAEGAQYDIGLATGVPFAIGYALCAVFLLLLARLRRANAPQ